ncbi:unnamed protein product [Arabidopsis halleri]
MNFPKINEDSFRSETKERFCLVHRSDGEGEERHSSFLSLPLAFSSPIIFFFFVLLSANSPVSSSLSL